MGYPLDGGSNEKNLKKVVPSIRFFVFVESARRYKCGQVQSAQEFIMYLDTDGAREYNFAPLYITAYITKIYETSMSK